MKRQAKRLWVLLLCLCMVLTTVAVPAAGADGNATGAGVHAGKTGANSLGTQTAESRKTAQTALLTGSESGQPAVLNENGGVSAQTTTAEVQTANELKQAIADTGKTKVKLTSNITIDTTLEVSRAVTLDLNGFMLKYENSEQNGSVIKVESSGKLTITDSRPEATSHKFKENEDGLWVLDENGDKSVTGGIITGGTGSQDQNSSARQRFGGGVFVSDNAEFVMAGGSIVGCYAFTDENSYRGYGGGISVGAGARFTMKQGAKIIGCRAYGGGGAYVTGGTFDMEDESAIASCYASGGNGGGVYSETSSEFIMHGDAKIHACRVKSNGGPPGRGGGVAAWGAFYMRDNSKITDCTAGDQRRGEGGGVYATGNFEMSGNAAIENCSAPKGGGVYSFLIATISDNARIDGTIYNIHTLNANGGTITGKVTNENESAPYFTGKITGDSNGGNTIFTNEVENKKGGVIEKGIFKNKVTNEADGVISGGIFEGDVTNESGGIINGGTFNGAVTNNGGSINGGTFNGALNRLVVSFDPNNGESITTQDVDPNTKKISKPSDPTKSGLRFDGWYNGEKKWDFETDTVTRTAMILTAKWSAVSSSSGGYYEWSQTPQISCGNGGKVVLSADGKTLTITPDAGKEIDKVLLNSKDLGAVSTVTNLKNGDKVEVFFKEKVTELTKEELTKQVKEAVSKASLKARSVKLKDGRLQITVSGDVQDLQALGYTVKYKYYRSTRKASGYKAALEKAGTTYTTGKGTKGTRYYYKARLMIYDKDGKLIAKSELKQCRYATRILRK